MKLTRCDMMTLIDLVNDQLEEDQSPDSVYDRDELKAIMNILVSSVNELS